MSKELVPLIITINVGGIFVLVYHFVLNGEI
jgi:hypothetical protein